jgi:hypothetical protein
VDLTKFVVEEPPPTKSGPRVWEERFESVITQGLTGQWINATEAWGVGSTNSVNAKRAAERCGVTMDARIHRKQLYICVK